MHMDTFWSAEYKSREKTANSFDNLQSDSSGQWPNLC